VKRGRETTVIKGKEETLGGKSLERAYAIGEKSWGRCGVVKSQICTGGRKFPELAFGDPDGERGMEERAGREGPRVLDESWEHFLQKNSSSGGGGNRRGTWKGNRRERIKGCSVIIFWEWGVGVAKGKRGGRA